MRGSRFAFQVVALMLAMNALGQQESFVPVDESEILDTVFEAFRGKELDRALLHLDKDFIVDLEGTQHTIPTMDRLFDDATLLPEISLRLSQALASNEGNPATLVHYGFRLLGTVAGGFGPPVAASSGNIPAMLTEEDLEHGLQVLKDAADFSFSADEDRAAWDMLPFDLRRSIATLLFACVEAYPVMQAYLEPALDYLTKTTISDHKMEDLYVILFRPWESDQLRVFEPLNLLEEMDSRKLAFASRLVLENMGGLLRYDPSRVQDFKGLTAISKFGEIRLSGHGSDTLSDPLFLAIDLGGDDLYLNDCGGTDPRTHPFGLVVDYGGNDRYNSTEGYTNAALGGISVLTDMKGDDEYVSEQRGLASAFYGTSLLMDLDGNDTYISRKGYSQGSAVSGVAMLVDIKGDDRYYCREHSQGFGGTAGAGILYDGAGDDLFTGKLPEFAKGTSPDAVTGSDPASFIQGAAMGRWAQTTDGHSLGGGYGALIDRAGDDEYLAGSFSQGAGYYFGTGFFADHSGDDIYNAVSHSQGYAVHFALACFFEGRGNDTYNAGTDHDRITQIIGSGRDFSSGWFLDMEGNDSYHFGNRSVGISDMEGIGIFWDGKGSDSYNWSRNNLYEGSPSMGKVIDNGMTPQSMFRMFEDKDRASVGVFWDNDETSIFRIIDGDGSRPFRPDPPFEAVKTDRLFQLFLTR